MFSLIDFNKLNKMELVFRVETYIILSPYGGDDGDADNVV